MVNELADKVDAELVEFEKAVDRLLFTTRIAKTQEYEELASLLIECRREVIKALRFAADMEKLKKAEVDVEIIWIRAEDRVSLIISSADNKFLPFAVEESVIYTAARRAVEELEKGEGDGKK